MHLSKTVFKLSNIILENQKLRNRLRLLFQYGSSFGTYAISYFLNAAISLLILPILSHYLSKEDYGIIALYTAAQTLILPFLGMGIQMSMGVDYFKKDKAEFTNYFNTAFKTILFSFFGFLLIAFAFNGFIASRLHITMLFAIMLPVYVLANLTADIYLSWLRNNEKAGTFVLFSVCRTVLEIGLAVLLVVRFSMGWSGRLYAAIAAASIVLIFLLVVFYKAGLLRWAGFDIKASKEVLLHSLPFVPERLSIFFLTASDRFFIERYASTEQVGLYNMAYNVASLIMMVIMSLSAVYVPVVYQALAMNNRAKAYKAALVNIAICLFFCLGMLVVIPIFFHFIIDHKFMSGISYAYYLMGSMFFWAVAQSFYPFLMFYKKNNRVMLFALVGAGVSVLLNFILTPHLQAWGAVIASGASYFTIATLYILYIKLYRQKMHHQ